MFELYDFIAPNPAENFNRDSGHAIFQLFHHIWAHLETF
jgi:hypothetical protein